ncbi:MAG: nuclear transport factor 2 family protein [Pseudomonadota bacterium]
MRLRPLHVLPLLALVQAAAWLLLRDSEQQRVLERLEQVRALASFDAPESALAQLNRARRLGAMFTAQTRYDLTTLDYGVTEIASREELIRRIAAARSRLSALELTLLAPVVQIEGDRATVELTGTALGTRRDGDGRFMDVHRVEIALVRQDGAWLVSGGRHLRDERTAFSGSE